MNDLKRVEILVRSVVLAHNKKKPGEELDAVMLHQEVIKGTVEQRANRIVAFLRSSSDDSDILTVQQSLQSMENKRLRLRLAEVVRERNALKKALRRMTNRPHSTHKPTTGTSVENHLSTRKERLGTTI